MLASMHTRKLGPLAVAPGYGVEVGGRSPPKNLKIVHGRYVETQGEMSTSVAAKND